MLNAQTSVWVVRKPLLHDKPLCVYVLAVADAQHVLLPGQAAHMEAKGVRFCFHHATQHQAIRRIEHLPRGGFGKTARVHHRHFMRHRVGCQVQVGGRAYKCGNSGAERELPIKVHLPQAVIVDALQGLRVGKNVFLDHGTVARAVYATDGLIARTVGAALHVEKRVVGFRQGFELQQHLFGIGAHGIEISEVDWQGRSYVYKEVVAAEMVNVQGFRIAIGIPADEVKLHGTAYVGQVGRKARIVGVQGGRGGHRVVAKGVGAGFVAAQLGVGGAVVAALQGRLYTALRGFVGVFNGNFDGVVVVGGKGGCSGAPVGPACSPKSAGGFRSPSALPGYGSRLH